MRFDLSEIFPVCILCKDRPSGSWEHIFPACVGGMFQANFLCKECNSLMGHDVVAPLREDGSIRYAIENLKSKLPELYRSMIDGLPYRGRSDDGSVVRVSIKNGKLRVLGGKGQGMSIIQDTRDAHKGFEKRMLEDGMDREQVEAWKRKFADLPENVPLPLPTGDVAVKKPLPQLHPEHKGLCIGLRLPALMAYEYAAWAYGKSIYDDCFSGLREFVLGGPARTVEVARLLIRSYETFHSLSGKWESGRLRVDVRFFGWVLFKVAVDTGGHPPRFEPAFVEELAPPELLVALDQEMFESNRFLSL